MDYTTQLRIGEIVRQLTQDGETFDRQAAKELLSLVPRDTNAPSMFGFLYRSQKSGGSVSGLTSSGQNASVEDETTTSYSTFTKGLWAGNYTVFLDDLGDRTVIHIEDRYLETREMEQQDKQWRLHYDRHGEPIELKKPRQRRIRIPIPFLRAKIGFQITAYVTWKLPA
jgi:hypothetical protein